MCFALFMKFLTHGIEINKIILKQTKMKKIYFLILVAFTNYCTANTVPVAKAKTVALNFLHSSIVSSSTNIGNITLLTSSTVTNANGESVPAYYIFGGLDNKGFIVISADDIVQPILGYSTESAVSITNLPPAFSKWMESYKKQIEFAIQNNMLATDKIKTAWTNMFNNVFPANRSPLAVNPLCATTWDQQPYVNELCPYDAGNTNNQHCVTGCPATAMAQIMKYWNYPAQGAGIHSYNHPTYGTLSANFGATTYNWGAMPNNVSSSNTAVSTLMFQCGVAVEMQYSANLSGGYVIINSPTPTACCEYAYKTYFGYNPNTIQGLERASYSDPNWITLLKTDLNASQPVQYAGFGSGGGHTFVCDGYDVSDNFHMNWGWGGYYDGFFAIGALNPGGVGTGGGTGGFNADQQAVIGIHPSTSVPVGTGLELYTAITITPNPIAFYGAFTVNADIANMSTATFNGDFSAALFNSNYEFVDYIQTFTGNTMAPSTHYTGGINFASAGILTVPGNYYVGIFYKESGGNWTIVANGSYSNMVPVTISGPVDYIKLNSAITATPVKFVQGQAASVNVNILNAGSTNYLGTFTVALYDLTGNYVETVGTYTESTGLPAGYTYNSPYLTFSSAAITSPPGTYLLAVFEQEVGLTAYLAGGDLFTNPVYIDVVAAAIVPDMYESNNTAATAYTLPLTWSGNTATKNTIGSNIHIGTDNDFYKINLTSGYTYQITARSQDSYSSNDGNTYTNDVLWSYDTGSGFSNANDDVMTGTIDVSGSSTVTFQVVPYFLGNIGTYRLDISVVRTTANSVDEITNELGVNFFPNPASESVSFKFNQVDCKINKIEVYDATGQLVRSQTSSLNNTIDISNLSKGIYFVSVSTNKGIVKSKFNVVK